MDLNIKAVNFKEIEKAFVSAPKDISIQIGRAVVASLFEVEKQAIDRNFQFKTPRSQRTGFLERSFKFGTVVGKEKGEIGPTAKYANSVHEGLGGATNPSNPFMVRILEEADPNIQKHFEDAIDIVINKIK